MVLLRIACLVALATCYQPNPPAGAPCSTNNECPFGQSCLRGTCRVVGGPIVDGAIPDDAFVPDGPPSDPDNDGFANAADNCPNKFNPDQHDEDGDLVGDACDNCPHVANANQANTGEGAQPDAVGDACDPRPTMPGDTIQKFIPFNTTMLTGASLSNGWAVEGDALRFTGDFAWIDIDGVRDRITVELGGTLENPGQDMYIWLDAGEANNEFYECAYWDFGGNPRDFHTALIGYFDGTNFHELAGNHNVANRLTGNFAIRMSADSVANTVSCTTVDARGTATKMAGANPLVPGSVSLGVEDGTFRLRYLIIFGQQ